MFKLPAFPSVLATFWGKVTFSVTQHLLHVISLPEYNCFTH